MVLVQFLLPWYDPAGARLPLELFDTTRSRLAERFGGVTTDSRAPARGLWKEEPGKTSHDGTVVVSAIEVRQLQR